MKRNFICGLDIGTFKICATCGRINSSGKLDILATQTVPAQGIQNGRINDKKKVSACIRDAVKKIYKNSGLRVRRVCANFDSPQLKAKECEERISFPEKTELRRRHIDKLMHSAISSKISLDRKVIHTGFRNFILDSQISSIYPCGRKARDIKINAVIISAPISAMRSFIECIEESGLILEDVAPSGCAQALSLFKDIKQNSEKNKVLVDIGAGQIKITFLRNRLIEDIVIIPQGAGIITDEVAAKLKLSLDCAEHLKVKYGRLLCDNLLNQKVIVKDKNVNKVVYLEQLYGVLALKVDYLLREIKKGLVKLNYKNEKIDEIIVTGGGSILEGFLERAEKTFGSKVKMGFLSSVNDSHIQLHSAIYATSVGLIQAGFINRNKKSFFPRKKAASFVRMFEQTKQLYREYF